jgi:hypothetical protein
MATTTRKKRTTTAAAKTPARRRRSTVAKRPAVRRRRPAKKGLLSEMFSPVGAMNGAKTLLSGAVGGLGAGLLGKLVPATTTPEMKAVYTGIAGFGAATLLKMPNVGAGMAAVATFQLFQAKGMLSEDFEYAEDLQALPMVLSEDQAMFLAQNNMYLAEDGNMYLAENSGYGVGYFPAGFGG